MAAGWRGILTRLSRPEIEPLALRGYRREWRSELTFPVAEALMEGGFIGVIADKVFHVHPLVLALISAAPMFGNLSSLLWAPLAQGRRKVPFIVRLQTLFVVCTAAVAAVPDGPVGSWLLVLALVVARLVLGGIITIRSLVWTQNYPRESRARVTSRLQILTMLTLTATAVAGSFFLDANPAGFRLVYAAGAVLATLGVLAFSRVPLLGEDAQLALERDHARGGRRAAARQAGLRAALSLLRRDRLFARYQTCQSVLGAANMMTEGPLIYLVSRQLQASYTTSIALTMAIPLVLSMLTLPFWAAYLDRVHISEFRARHSWIWVVALGLTWIGAALASLWLVAAGRVVLGLGRGGGSLAWQLGHNDFASRENAALYMGIHVTLTGIRGAVAPFLGMALYVGWSGMTIPGLGLELPAFAGIGPHAFGVAAVASVVATLGFGRLHRAMRETG